MATADIASADDSDPATYSVTTNMWTVAGVKKRKPIDRSADDLAYIVYVTGKNSVITKMNPLAVCDKIKSQIGTV